MELVPMCVSEGTAVCVVACIASEEDTRIAKQMGLPHPSTHAHTHPWLVNAFLFLVVIVLSAMTLASFAVYTNSLEKARRLATGASQEAASRWCESWGEFTGHQRDRCESFVSAQLDVVMVQESQSRLRETCVKMCTTGPFEPLPDCVELCDATWSDWYRDYAIYVHHVAIARAASISAVLSVMSIWCITASRLHTLVCKDRGPKYIDVPEIFV